MSPSLKLVARVAGTAAVLLLLLVAAPRHAWAQG